MPRAIAARAPLSRDVVLTAAVALADERGLEGVSMRHLADALGVVPMALYKHVGDKEDLLDGMVEHLLTGLGVGGTTGHQADRTADHTSKPLPWREAVTGPIHGVRALHRSHPWFRRVLETRQVRTPAVLAHMERLTSAFLAAGFTPDLTHHVMHLLGNRIWGFSPELFNQTGGPPTRRSTAPTPDPTDYPGILAVAADSRARRPTATSCDEDGEFDFALATILDAAEHLQRSGWSSPT